MVALGGGWGSYELGTPVPAHFREYRLRLVHPYPERARESERERERERKRESARESEKERERESERARERVSDAPKDTLVLRGPCPLPRHRDTSPIRKRPPP